MISHRHDSLLTRLGERGERNLWRLWVEDNGFDRLRRNNFAPGTPFRVRRRPGTGLIVEQTTSGSCHVSSRRGAGLLSYEASDIGDFIGTPDVRVRIHVGQIFVTPALRLHSVLRRQADQHWTIDGDIVHTAAGDHALRSAGPLALPRAAASIKANINEANLVYVTELIGNQRPGRVEVQGEPIMLTIADQFLVSVGYGQTGVKGVYER